ncbi:MurR/RpiR family transcriptional regulator [Bacillus sp. B1-b2]|uniref:MurR/RpiR family transcriptional regulator n=1 Tax=Bacillus sp. B1-b2 TaxID=2653201 RepID=UPI001D01F7B2|nr:MurR/RpiR family transcriptional regulator [Bacillus sp. B1-b2]
MASRTDFTASENTIAQYILNNTNKMEKMTIQELARETFTSNASIIRFAQKMGMEGFKDFKIRLVQSIEQRKLVLSDINPNIPFEDDASIMKIGQDMMHLAEQAIKESYQLLNEASLFQMTKYLYQAERIFLYAAGDSQIRAESFQNKLGKINKYAILATARDEFATNTANLTSMDCALFITYEAKSKNDWIAANILKEKNVPILLLTAFPESELAKYSDVMLTVPLLETQKIEKIATFSSQIALDYLLNVLFSTLYQIDYTANRNHQLKNAELLKRFLDQ